MAFHALKHSISSISRLVFQFIAGENSGDAFRNIFTTLVPSIIIFYTGHLDTAITVGMGALLSSLTDLPGNRQDKWKSAKWCIPLFFIASFATAYAISSAWLLLPLLIISGFVCAMLSVFGLRVGINGTLTLILISFVVGLWPSHPLSFSIEITLGAVWFYMISILQAYIVPYRSLRHAMADGFRSMAVLLQAKAKCYDEHIPLEKAYRELGRLHIQVSDQQETIRFLLLREKKLISSEDGKIWLDQVYQLIDLYELLMALDHDYESIRNTLGPTGALKHIRKLIIMIAREIDLLAANPSKKIADQHTNCIHITPLLHQLTTIRDQQEGEAYSILNATIRNIQLILDFITRIRSTSDAKVYNSVKENEYQHFLSLPPRGWTAVKNQLSFHSTIFPFALRLAVLFGLGGLFGMILPEYRYTYWILLTIAIVARPGFATTQRRNFQRITGTLTGILLGILILNLISNIPVLLIIAAVCLYGFFLFNKPNYLVSVLFITAGIVITLNSYEGNIDRILGSRIIFTLIGCLLAVAGYFFVPIRQKRGMLNLADLVVQHNKQYFKVVDSQLQDHQPDIYEIRLARKKAQTALASFSDTITQLQHEPGNKKKDWSDTNTFHALAYRINSLIVGLSINVTLQYQSAVKSQQLDLRIQAISNLLDELDQLAKSLRQTM
ncbi:FUSC family membrane protein [Sphingobacterium spiritivorum]|uniref:FUSC family protein n=1 Tax=Sphingobacterium spiritivorum TaxID=258 RepID=UPI003DA46078